MLDLVAAERRRAWHAMLDEAQPADWVRRMVEDYWRTGTSRPDDLNRLLGDPTKGVEVGPNTSLATMFSAKKSAQG